MTESGLTLPPAQGLVVTSATALAHGWTYAELARAVRRGTLHRVVEGAYVPKAAWATWDERSRHLALARGKLATRGAEWALARRTAAVAHGAGLLGRIPARPQLIRPWTGIERASSRFERVATLGPEDLTVVAGLRATSMARTAVDLAREESFQSAVVVLDSLLRAGAQPEELVAVVERCGHWPGAAQAARAVAFADGRAETPIESLARVMCGTVGVPAFEPQVEVWCGAEMIGRVDGLWREWGVVAEADGKAKYASRDVLVAEKQRQDWLDDVGLVVVRWDWEESRVRQAAFGAKLERGRRRAKGRRLDPSVHFVSTTLAQSQARAARDRHRAAAQAS